MVTQSPGTDLRTVLKRMPFTLRVGNIPGGDTEFIDIQAAVDYAATQGGNWTIFIHPGAYASGIDLTAAPGVNLCGLDKENCIITVNDGEIGVTMGAGCSIRNLTFNVTVTGTTSIGVECGDASCTIEDCNFVLQRTGGVVAIGIDENTDNTAQTIYIRNVRMHSLIDTNITCIYIQQDNKTVYIENSWCEGGDRGLRVAAISTVYSTNNYWEALDDVASVALEAAGAIYLHNDTLESPVVQTAGTMTYQHGDAEYWVFNHMSIQDALDALPVTGGKVVLMEGTWAITDPITIPQNNVTLCGQGVSSFIDGDGLATTEHGIVISGVTGCLLRDFSIQTEDGGGKVCHCIFVEDGATNTHIENIEFVDSDADAIHIEGTTMYDVHVHCCHIEDADGYGIFVDMDAANFFYRGHFNDNLIIGTGTSGIFFGNTGTASQYCQIVNNLIYGGTTYGIQATDMLYCTFSSNIIAACGNEGIILGTSSHCNLEGNVCQGNGGDGIEMATSPNNIILDNACQSNGQSGIYMDGASHGNKIDDNHCCFNTWDGIRNGGNRCSIEGNIVHENEQHGIQSAGIECQINDNYVYDNSQETAGTYYGILLTADALRTQVNDNYINDPGDSQGDGIHLDAGADYVQIVGNYCYNAYGGGASSGSGIYLEDNDHCLIKVNYCYLNDGYGVEIAAGSDNTVLNNKLIGNVTGQISDGGTDTILPEVIVRVPNPNSNIGAHPATLLTDGLAVLDRLDLYVPADFVELVRAVMVIVPGGTGNLRRSVATDWGKICSEVYNVDSDALADDTNVAVTINVLECVDISGALDGIAAMDEVGIAFTRHGENALDTVNANCYLLKFRMQYV